MQLGDYVLGLASSGFHSNGYSLIRRVIQDQGLSWHDRLLEQTIGEWCLTPTTIYVNLILDALAAGMEIHGLAHITGGGHPPKTCPVVYRQTDRCRLRPGKFLTYSYGYRPWATLPL